MFKYNLPHIHTLLVLNVIDACNFHSLHHLPKDSLSFFLRKPLKGIKLSKEIMA